PPPAPPPPPPRPPHADADAATSTDAASGGDPFSICIPPPNVTAALHLGHALNNTLQDVLTRAARMQGKNAVWLPGTDHAGIATQTVVDKRLQAEGKKALKDYKQQEATSGGGRDAFIAEVQKWKDEYERRITDQLKAMGCSCDWDRQAFTMDDARSKAVREAFFQLFKDGLIYRGKRLVNWDPVTQTALADDEVEMEDVDGNFYYLKYPLWDPETKSEIRNSQSEIQYVTVATTRPETMLGDTAVAVNPDDAPRAKYVGQFVKLPIVGRVIPIIADDYVVIPDEDSDDSKARMASGFLKVTPAHDPNDYDIGQRHDLPIINVMAPDASISTQHGWPPEEQPEQNKEVQPFLGLSREDARREIVKWFKAHDLCDKIVSYRHAVGHSYRSHVPVEPYYSDQWYLEVTNGKLRGAALRAMDESQRSPSDDEAFNAKTPSRQDAEEAKPATGLKFTPERYAKTFQTWHENLRDWCISRQLWWGHRIPVWFVHTQPGSAEQFAGGVDKVIARHGLSLELSTRIESEELVLVCSQNAAGDALVEGINAWLSSDKSRAKELRTNFAWLDQIDWDELCNEVNSCQQDPDVLDTWFSSALWPMSTLGWPEDSPDLDLWNPTSVLCTAREIITLWVSRMVMFNLYFRGTLPFKDVFIHAMIQDGHGQKMSK
ncbi:MAG: class I tRNA ligase family protein, partial [Planctomycetota bacterium]